MRRSLPGATPERIIVVPGNHDVAWERDGKLTAEQRYSLFRKHTRTFTTPWLNEVHPPDVSHRPYFYSPERGLLVYALDSTTLSGRLADLNDEQSARLGDLEAAFVKRKKIGGRPAAGALEVFVRSLSLHDGAAIGSAQLRVMSKHLAELQGQHGEAFARSFKVAVLHHDVGSIPSAAVEMKTFELIVDAAILKRALVEFGFHLVLHGHKHVPHLTRDGSVQEASHFGSDDKALFVLCGGTIGGESQSGIERAFNWIAVANAASIWSCAPTTVITRRESPIAQAQNLHDQIDNIVAASARQSAEKTIGDIERALQPFMPGPTPPLHMPDEFEDLVRKLRNVMGASGNRVYATDVLGPTLWLQPESNTYFSIQVRPYLEVNARNASRTVTLELDQALQRAVANHEKLVPQKADRGASPAMDDIETTFDRLGTWQVGEPPLELIRILIWPTEQLETSAAEATIRLHEGFSIPLFFLSAEEPSLGFDEWRNRTVDYCLKCDAQRLQYGFYGYSDRPAMHEISDGQVAPIDVLRKKAPYRTLREEFMALLGHPKLLLASHARMC